MLLNADVVHAESATWNLNPVSVKWQDEDNWMPATVPKKVNDIATFGISSQTKPVANQVISIDSIVFAADASDYNIVLKGGAHAAMELNGAGIVNNSGRPQRFTTQSNRGYRGNIGFYNDATAGTLINFINNYGFIAFFDTASATTAIFTNISNDPIGGELDFLDSSTAANALVHNLGTVVFWDSSSAENASLTNEGSGASISFLLSATADHATVTNNGAVQADAVAGNVIFASGAPTAANGLFVNNGGTASGAAGALMSFFDSSTAGGATLVANGGENGGGGAKIQFIGKPTGDHARVELFDGGTLEISNHINGVTIGSLEGNGLVSLGSNRLSIGSNGLSTVFSGVISDSSGIGSLQKLGPGTLTLSGPNSYGGTTTLAGGSLVIANSSGSGTGTGPVGVTAGTLRGSGIIAGQITVGTGGGPGAFLEPGTNAGEPSNLTVEDAVTFKVDSTYTYRLNTQQAIANQVVAGGVTIETGAQFAFSTTGNKKLILGTVFVALVNTSTNPIMGTFGNLADASTITIGSNTFQASYEGGDGNDLTLTVVP
jgi:autotransporter-associated beta strand protein